VSLAQAKQKDKLKAVGGCLPLFLVKTENLVVYICDTVQKVLY
jgi:hypothetical protein